MKLITKIEIHRFRSIADNEIIADELVIFSGKNNSGKSNVLKALNLFFATNSSFGQEYSFENDYNKAFTGQAGGKRKIEITLHFDKQGDAALKAPFSISRSFTIGTIGSHEYHSSNPTVEELLRKNDGNTIRQFTRFKNTLEYIYIPAIRDKKFVRSLLLRFENLIEIDSGKEFSKRIDDLSEILKKKSNDISVDFQKFIGLPTRAALSSNITDILGAVEIKVETGLKVNRRTKTSGTRPEAILIDLFSSGDGILMSYLTYFLAHICRKIENKRFVWGFEEPENSLEYTKVQQIAADFSTNFTKFAQIFVTTHSPAFINLHNNKNTLLYRVYIKLNDIKQISEIRQIKELEIQQQSLFKEGKVNDDNYIELTKEINFVEQAVEIQKKVTLLTDEISEAQRQQEEYKTYLMKIEKLKPKKIFVCEDEDSESIKLWESLLKNYGIEGVTVWSSHGSTDNRIEVYVKQVQNIDASYQPRVFREIDRDGLSDMQAEYIAADMQKRTPNNVKYKLEYLPFNELENISVLIYKETFTEQLFENNRDKLEDELHSCATESCKKHSKKYRDKTDLFDLLNSSTITTMKKFARTDWRKYFPGKQILPLAKVEKLSSENMNNLFERLPSEMLEYLHNIKTFFDE